MKKLNTKGVVITTAVVLVTIFTLFGLSSIINPIAAFAAITVALIGLFWFKKTNS